MDLASRVFDVVTKDDNQPESFRELLPQLYDPEQRSDWKRHLRLAALCHDIGHLAFSHAPEELLPKDVTHEDVTRNLILSNEMNGIWRELEPAVRPERIAKLAVGPRHAGDLGQFNDCEAILTEIITGDAFGVDRIDYLVRDAHHTGVAYGRFDYYRLIDTLRILTPPKVPEEGDGSKEPSLGIEFGGLAAAEAMLLARYYMFRTVYFHPVSRIYSVHLKDFLVEHRSGKPFDIDYESHLQLTDNEVIAALRAAAYDASKRGHAPAQRILKRKHFKVLYEWNRQDAEKYSDVDVTDAIYKQAAEKFGRENLRIEKLPEKGSPPEFWIKLRNGSVASALEESRILEHIPTQKGEWVFIDPTHLEAGQKWLKDNLDSIMEETGSEDNAKS
jgi:hypothetical protein